MQGPFGAGPFGGGSSVGGAGGFPPPHGFGSPTGIPPIGGVVVHGTRLVSRLVTVAVFMGISFLVTGLVVWFAVFQAADGVDLGEGRTRTVERGAQAVVVDPEVSLPEGWPTTLSPPEGAVVTRSSSSGFDTPDEQLVLVYEVSGPGPATVDGVRMQLAAAGLTVTTEAVDDAGTGALTASGAGWDASITVGPVTARPGVTTVSWVLSRSLR